MSGRENVGAGVVLGWCWGGGGVGVVVWGGLALSQLCLKHFGSSPSAAPVRLTTVSLSRHQRCKVTAGVASMSVR